MYEKKDLLQKTFASENEKEIDELVEDWRKNYSINFTQSYGLGNKHVRVLFYESPENPGTKTIKKEVEDKIEKEKKGFVWKREVEPRWLTCPSCKKKKNIGHFKKCICGDDSIPEGDPQLKQDEMPDGFFKY